MENKITLPIVEKTDGGFTVRITKELLTKINKEPLELIQILTEENLLLKEKVISLEKNYNSLYTFVMKDIITQVENLNKDYKNMLNNITIELDNE